MALSSEAAVRPGAFLLGPLGRTRTWQPISTISVYGAPRGPEHGPELAEALQVHPAASAWVAGSGGPVSPLPQGAASQGWAQGRVLLSQGL